MKTTIALPSISALSSSSRSRASRLGCWATGALSALAVAAFAGWLYWQISIADAVLEGTGSLRQSVRATYRSSVGYGPEGAAPQGNWAETLNSQRQVWSDAGSGQLRGPDNLSVQVISRVKAFDVNLEGVPPLACRMVVNFLDDGWADARVNGASVSTRTGTASSAACGWWRSATLSLTSAG